MASGSLKLSEIRARFGKDKTPSLTMASPVLLLISVRSGTVIKTWVSPYLRIKLQVLVSRSNNLPSSTETETSFRRYLPVSTSTFAISPCFMVSFTFSYTVILVNGGTSTTSLVMVPAFGQQSDVCSLLQIQNKKGITNNTTKNKKCLSLAFNLIDIFLIFDFPIYPILNSTI